MTDEEDDMLTEHERSRIIIQRQIADYLASGGNIEVVDHTANFEYRQPVKRSRKDQVAHMRRFGRVRGRQPR